MGLTKIFFNILSGVIFGIYEVLRDIITLIIVVNKDIEEITGNTGERKTFKDLMNDEKDK